MKKNQIVKVISGKAFGNEPETITKILSKPGRLPDQLIPVVDKLHSDRLKNKVLCESITGPKVITLNNKSVCYEYIDDLVLATEEEKIDKLKNKSNG